ncbi:MAG TPA: 50S ribosomal protein L11 methyltransferase [Verrucomicrobiae bacterium]|nr:50S ribosomal protein L11 methyltransferase [Verrucomicrobiae bacterium]
MKSQPLWQLSLSVSEEAEDAINEIVAGLVGQYPQVYVNEETRERTASVYLSGTVDEIRARATALKESLAAIPAAGLAWEPEEVHCNRVKREDWRESWKRHFKPLAIGSRLLIKPGWSKLRPRPGQAVVILDPGLSFGTGQHATTSFCLQQLVACRQARREQSFLDIGTGSGILAIAAVKLGYSPVRAFDFDPQAVHVATANARRNRVNRRLSLARQDLTRLPAGSRVKYDVICANLIYDLLLAERNRILARLKPGGRLVLAGILATQFDQVRAAYEEAGLTLVADRVEKEWRSGRFDWRD